ncbi:spherulin-1b protein [Pochonia chlamydosporia 170]|uniref:Spherulin-1b protein n=1 Tax=Pochonia chlamydosporia 170 TaxID=1380566 RepID=A0A179F435_METCM|nr:spherulin-1b protein [Pochonia chlamydosporia 170]OAQ60187.1 spherulin-1b protein [Pochonia chlamydosporia 170]
MQLVSFMYTAILGYVTVSSAYPTLDSLSLTQQLFLADTAVDRFSLLPNDTQFVFDFNKYLNDAGEAGAIVAANRQVFPALVGTGSGMAVGRIGACGMNTLHVHPRSTELQLVVEGRLITEMNPENGVLDHKGNRRVIRNIVEPFQMTPFYQGSMHTQFNPDCNNVTFIASFASEDFGTEQVADGIFSFSNEVLAATFGQTIAGESLDLVRNSIPPSIALGVETCLQQCGMQKRTNY